VNQSQNNANGILTINLGAIRSNWRLLQKVTSQNCQVSAVIKADAYGLGAQKIFKTLRDEGCQKFFVATLEEALCLKKLDSFAEIYVLNGPDPGTESEFLTNNLYPVINSMEQFKRWREKARYFNLNSSTVLHIDTGMNRLGISLDEAKNIALQENWKPSFIMSHLACAGIPSHPQNLSQWNAFKTVKNFFPQTKASLSASSGIFLGQEWHFDIVRSGGALWGLNPTLHLKNPMKQVVTLKGKVIQCRHVQAGDSVGYGAYRVDRSMTLAIVAVGYADGILRTLENKHLGYISHQKLKLVGVVSMDMIMIDITHIPEDMIKPGDYIDILGDHFTADDAAQSAGTLGYEILTSLGHRYERHYLDDVNNMDNSL
jgi:alanine racemase